MSVTIGSDSLRDIMILTDNKVKSGILAIILAAVMIFSAFVVCAGSNIVAADGSSGGGTATTAKVLPKR